MTNEGLHELVAAEAMKEAALWEIDVVPGPIGSPLHLDVLYVDCPLDPDAIRACTQAIVRGIAHRCGSRKIERPFDTYGPCKIQSEGVNLVQIGHIWRKGEGYRRSSDDEFEPCQEAVVRLVARYCVEPTTP